MQNVRRRSIALTVAAFAVLAGLGFIAWATTSSAGGMTWKSYEQMEQSPESASIPTLVEPDSTQIRLSTPSFGKSDTLISWQSSSGITRKDCTAGPVSITPDTRPSWWPDTQSTEGWSCGWWRVFQHDDAYYAWQNPRTRN